MKKKFDDLMKALQAKKKVLIGSLFDMIIWANYFMKFLRTAFEEISLISVGEFFFKPHF